MRDRMFLSLKWEGKSVVRDLFQPMPARVIQCRVPAVEILAVLVRNLHKEFEIRKGMEGQEEMLGKAQVVKNVRGGLWGVVVI